MIPSDLIYWQESSHCNQCGQSSVQNEGAEWRCCSCWDQICFKLCSFWLNGSHSCPGHMMWVLLWPQYFFPWASLISAGLCCVIMSTFPSLKEQVTFYHIFKAHGSFLKSWQWKLFGATCWKWIFHQKWKLVSSPVSFSLFYGWNHKINQSGANLHMKTHFHLLAFLVTGL